MNTQDSQSTLEDILIARVKVIGDNEWTVLGYPDELIKEIETYVTTRIAEATSKPLPREIKLAAKVANLEQKIVMLEADVTTRVKEALQDVLNEYAKQYQKHLLDMGRSGKTPFTIFHKIINTQYKALTTTTNGKEE